MQQALHYNKKHHPVWKKGLSIRWDFKKPLRCIPSFWLEPWNKVYLLFFCFFSFLQKAGLREWVIDLMTINRCKINGRQIMGKIWIYYSHTSYQGEKETVNAILQTEPSQTESLVFCMSSSGGFGPKWFPAFLNAYLSVKCSISSSTAHQYAEASPVLNFLYRASSR